MPRKLDTQLHVKDLHISQAVTINLGDFESMRFEMGATVEVAADSTPEQTQQILNTWVADRLRANIVAEIQDHELPPSHHPKPAGQVARHYKANEGSQ